MKLYLKYILFGVVIGIVVLALLSLAGCEDKKGEAKVEKVYSSSEVIHVKPQPDTLNVDFICEFCGGQMIYYGTIEGYGNYQHGCIEQRTAAIEQRIVELETEPNEPPNMNALRRISKLEDDVKISRYLQTGDRVRLDNLTDTYLSDIDPNAPINTHLLKISDSWAKEYGASHESVLKYNTVAAWAFAQRALQQIVVLDKRIKALEPVEGMVKIEADGSWYAYSGIDWVKIVDPNEVKE